MTIPKLALHGLDTVQHTRRVAESINNILSFDNDDWRRQIKAEKEAGITPLNSSYPPGYMRRYGAKLDSSTDDTAAIKRGLDFCIASGVEAVLDGDAVVTGPITGTSSVASGILRLRCIGDVTITVDAASTAFNTLIKCHTTAINSSVIHGGRLTLELNEKCATGLYLRHGGGNGGTVDWGPVTVKNALNNDSSDVVENQGILIFGRYESVTLNQPIIDGVDRTNTSGGACKGISISDTVGPVVINDPHVSRVLCTGSSADADGIAVFARDTAGSTYAARPGSMLLKNPVITDCQGRSVKTQISESTIIAPVIRRQMVVAFGGPDIDHQIGGNHEIISPSFEYRLNGATAPFTGTFFPFGFQQQCIDRPNNFRITGGCLRTEVAPYCLAYVSVSDVALDGAVSINGFEVQNITITTKSFTSAVVEIDAENIQDSGGTHISIRNVRGNFSDCVLLAYSDASAANMSKLSFDLIGNENTGADHADSDVIQNVGGATTINQVRGFNIRDNSGFTDYLGAWVFDAMALKVGCRFQYERASSTVANGPTISAGSYVFVECLGALSNGLRNVRMTVDDANAANTVYYSQTNAAWGVIK